MPYDQMKRERAQLEKRVKELTNQNMEFYCEATKEKIYSNEKDSILLHHIQAMRHDFNTMVTVQSTLAEAVKQNSDNEQIVDAAAFALEELEELKLDTEDTECEQANNSGERNFISVVNEKLEGFNSSLKKKLKELKRQSNKCENAKALEAKVSFVVKGLDAILNGDNVQLADTSSSTKLSEQKPDLIVVKLPADKLKRRTQSVATCTEQSLKEIESLKGTIHSQNESINILNEKLRSLQKEMNNVMQKSERTTTEPDDEWVTEVDKLKWKNRQMENEIVLREKVFNQQIKLKNDKINELTNEIQDLQNEKINDNRDKDLKDALEKMRQLTHQKREFVDKLFLAEIREEQLQQELVEKKASHNQSLKLLDEMKKLDEKKTQKIMKLELQVKSQPVSIPHPPPSTNPFLDDKVQTEAPTTSAVSSSQEKFWKNTIKYELLAKDKEILDLKEIIERLMTEFKQMPGGPCKSVKSSKKKK